MIIITKYETTAQGVILETNIPSTLKNHNVPSKEHFISWDKIGNLLFDDYEMINHNELRVKSIREELAEQLENQSKTLVELKKDKDERHCEDCKYCYYTSDGNHFSCANDEYFCDFGYGCEKFEYKPKNDI